MEVRKVCVNKGSGQKYVTIPAGSEIEAGDFVKIVKIKNEEDMN